MSARVDQLLQETCWLLPAPSEYTQSEKLPPLASDSVANRLDAGANHGMLKSSRSRSGNKEAIYGAIVGVNEEMACERVTREFVPILFRSARDLRSVPFRIRSLTLQTVASGVLEIADGQHYNVNTHANTQNQTG